MNWVEQRAKRESILYGNAQTVWGEIRAALQDSCNSYNEHYGFNPNRKELNCKLENGHRVVITRTLPTDGVSRFQDTQMEVVIWFDPAIPAVHVAHTSPASSDSFQFGANDSEAFPTDGQNRISADDLARHMLEPMLFPAGEKKRPIFRAESSGR